MSNVAKEGEAFRVWPVILLVSLFFLWGAANNLNDILIKQFKKAFTLGDMQASLVQSAFYVGYFMGALPAANLARWLGFRSSIMTGLGLYSLGALLFFPVSRDGGSYMGFLCCLYMIAFGLSFLESGANPWIILLGDASRKGFGTRALNIAQSFNALGSIVGILVGRMCILDGHEAVDSALESRAYRQQEAARVGLPYIVLGLVVATIAGLFGVTTFPRTAAEELQGQVLTLAQLGESAGRLWRCRGYASGLLAQFGAVGGQVSSWSFLIRLVQEQMPGTPEQQAADAVLVALVMFLVGRFFSSALLKVVSPSHVLTMYAGMSTLACFVAALAGGKLSVVLVCVASFFKSVMFPTIFGLVLTGLPPQDTEVGSAFLIMCIVGGAIATPVMGYVSDASSVARSYVVPCGCLLVVMSYGLQHSLGRFSDSPSKAYDSVNAPQAKEEEEDEEGRLTGEVVGCPQG